MNTDTYTKIVLTICAVCLVWISVKDTRLEPVALAQVSSEVAQDINRIARDLERIYIGTCPNRVLC